MRNLKLELVPKRKRFETSKELLRGGWLHSPQDAFCVQYPVQFIMMTDAGCVACRDRNFSVSEIFIKAYIFHYRTETTAPLARQHVATSVPFHCPQFDPCLVKRWRGTETDGRDKKARRRARNDTR